MSVARLAENIMLDRGDRFALFYGNVNDEFYDDDLVCGSIDFMLWRYFCQEQGYQRVVFFHGADKITFYDEQSRRACLPEQPPVAGSRPSATSSLKGPLGRRKLLSHQSSIGSDGRSSPQVAAISDPSPQADASRPQRRMSDLSALEILDFIIRNDADSLATAVIFPLAEDIRRFEGASLREIQNRMLRWIRVSSKVPRICVFVFQQTTEEEVEEIAKSYELHIVYNFIKQKRGDNANMVRVGYPDAQEILNLLHHYRLRVGLKVDWSILDDMAQFLCNQRLPMKRLNSMLAAVHGLNRDTLRAWSKTGRIRSTEYLIENIGKEMRMDTGHLIEQLSSVHCQEDSTAQLVNAVAEWHALIEKKKPLTLFLAGTSGVGKTYTVELLAEALQHLGYEYCYFAMTEFSQEHAVSNLIGSPKGYVGSEDEPKLFEALHRSKKLIICFDEIEKAHDKIIKALMQLMEKGFLSWSKGEEDFRECIICFTSNAQMQKVVDLKHRFVRNGKQTDGPEFQNAIRDVLVQAQIAPEVCGRINRFLVYSPLTPEAIVRITHQEVNKLARGYGLEVIYTAPEFLAEVAEKTANSMYGARPIQNEVSARLGRILVPFSSNADIRQIVINRTAAGYAVVPVSDPAGAPSYHEMIDEGVATLAEKLSTLSCLDTEQLSTRLSPVHCQQDNIAQLVDAVEIWHALIEKKKPLTLFLAGTSGVGKTYTVELLAEALQHLGYEYCYFAMTEFSQEHAVSNLIGSPKGYVGSEDEPKLFEALHRSKKLIICFDEIEKAHDKIIKALMQLMEKGFLSWSKGEEDFRECIICFTSNAQMQKVVDLKHRFVRNGKQTDGPEFQNAIRDVLVQAQIAPEVCGRINRFLVYSPLTPEAIVRITHQEVNKLARGYGLEVIYTAPEFLAEVAEKTANSMYGARPVQNEVSSRLGKAMLSLKKQEPEARKVLIKRTGDVYQAVSVEGVVDGLSYDGMIEHSMKLISLNDRPAGRAATDSGTQPKRLLRLHEIPTSLSKRKPRSAASSPLESIRPAVGCVKVEQADGTEGSGSGFVITPDGRFITSFHVVENAQSIRVRFDDYPDTWFGAELLDADKQADIAVLKLEGGKFTWVLMTPYGDKVELGESVGLLGYPLGEDLGNLVTYTAGVVSSYREGPGGTSLFQIDASAYNGSSGGPLLRLRDGRVIGILMGGWKEAAGLNLAVSIDELYKRLVREY